MNKQEIKLGFIGCGHMASSIIKGILDSGFVETNKVIASELNEEFGRSQSKKLGIKVLTDNKILAKNSDVIFLATKPNLIKEVLKEIDDELTEEKLVISIAAGVSTNTLETAIGKQIPLIRIMPNAPAAILEGMSGIVKGKFAKDEDVEFCVSLFSTIGKTLIIEEDKIDVLTAISGSGPAFFYKTINEIARAGEKLGLKYEHALMLSIQTAIGSAKLMQGNPLSPEELISGIATNGGCTQVGVDYMSASNSQELFFNTIQKTAQKARELGQ